VSLLHPLRLLNLLWYGLGLQLLVRAMSVHANVVSGAVGETKAEADAVG
jgi:hypothetical protein